MLFQLIIFFFQWNIKGDIWQNVRAALYNDSEWKIRLPCFKTDKKHQKNAPENCLYGYIPSFLVIKCYARLAINIFYVTDFVIYLNVIFYKYFLLVYYIF